MKKSDYGFDLRNFLVENKLTESGREKRYHFKKTFLSEMIMPAEDGTLEYTPDEEQDVDLDQVPDIDPFEVEPAEELGMNDIAETNGDDVQTAFDNWYPMHEFEFDNENEAYDYFEQNVFGQEDIDECDPDMGAGNPLEELKKDEKDPLYRELTGYQTKYGEDKGLKIFKHFHPELSDDDLGKLIPQYARHNTKINNDIAQHVNTTGNHTRKVYNDDPKWEGDDGYKPGHRSMEEALDEAGYTDDEDDDLGYSDDLDLTAGDNFANSVGNKKSKKAFDKSNDTDFDAPDAEDFSSEFSDPEDLGDEEDDIPAAKTGKDGSNVTDLVAKFHADAGKEYNPEAVDLEFEDDQEFEEYLQGFSRPPVALKCLERAIRQAEKEVNDGISKRIYLVFKDGFYETQAFRRGNVVATIYRTEEFGSGEED